MLQSGVYIYRFVNAQYYKILVFSSASTRCVNIISDVRYFWRRAVRARTRVRDFLFFTASPTTTISTTTSMNINLITLPVCLPFIILPFRIHVYIRANAHTAAIQSTICARFARIGNDVGNARTHKNYRKSLKHSIILSFKLKLPFIYRLWPIERSARLLCVWVCTILVP